ncbi:MAG TPA: rRNA maturation RNase YbeY [Xanthobacteraceae bacterium]|jgi:probable rRNA maturation factor|nr:rRNA maturation RNase YbeY [Xanthobacteraceae bacterium]
MSDPANRPTVDVMVSSPLWEACPEAESILHRAIAAAAADTQARIAANSEVVVLLTDDAAIRILNRNWRGIDKPTNVLSFPAAQSATPEEPAPLGDIAIAYETLEREARAESKSFDNHLAHLAVHGFLHLLGYDHESEEEAEVMERLECAILSRLDIPDPYAIYESEV